MSPVNETMQNFSFHFWLVLLNKVSSEFILYWIQDELYLLIMIRCRWRIWRKKKTYFLTPILGPSFCNTVPMTPWRSTYTITQNHLMSYLAFASGGCGFIQEYSILWNIEEGPGAVFRWMTSAIHCSRIISSQIIHPRM